MSDLLHVPRRAAMRFLGLPRGMGLLFSRRTRRQLGLAVAGSVAIAFLDVVAITALVPLTSLLVHGAADGPATVALGPVSWTPPTDHPAAVLIGTVLALFVVKGLLTIAFRWWLLGVFMREQIATSRLLLDHYLRAPYVLHLQRTTADLVGTMNEGVRQVYSQAVMGAVLALSDLIAVVAVVLTLLVLVPGITLVAVAYLATAAFVFQRYSRPHVTRAGAEMLAAAKATFQAAVESLGVVKEVQIRQGQPYFTHRYATAALRTARAQRRTAFLGEVPKHLMEVLFLVGIGLVGVASLRGASAADAIGGVAIAAAAGFRILPNIVRAMASLNQVRSASVAIDRVLDDVRLALARPAGTGDGGPPMPFAHDLVLENVSFTYPTSATPALEGIDLVVPAGASVALVGASGGGKSTLVDIVTGIHRPASGRVLVDGVDVAGDLAAWQRNIGTVPQQIWLVSGGVSANVALAEEPTDIDEARIWTALEQAHLREVVDGLPDGLHTDLGDNGVRLSGGQRQRLGIARALYRRPRLLVLDEATSAMDNETERQITETISELRGSLTMLVVAHRLSTVRHCDVIAMVEGGRITATGTFEELVRDHEPFAALVRLGRLD